MSLSLSNVIASTTADDEGLAHFAVKPNHECAMVQASGEIDIATSPRLSEALLVAVDHCPRVVVDMREVTFLDSTGLNVLVSGYHHARGRDGDLALVGPAGIVRNALHVTGLHKLLTIRDSVEDAVTAITRGHDGPATPTSR
jgi:anti-anti-sigma factor